MIVTAVVYAILLRIAGGAGLAGLLLAIMVMLSLLRYGYAVLRHVASGWENFPPPDIESFMLVGGLGAVLHPALFGASMYFLTTTPLVEGPLRWALLVVVFATFPASAAIMAMTLAGGPDERSAPPPPGVPAPTVKESRPDTGCPSADTTR